MGCLRFAPPFRSLALRPLLGHGQGATSSASWPVARPEGLARPTCRKASQVGQLLHLLTPTGWPSMLFGPWARQGGGPAGPRAPGLQAAAQDQVSAPLSRRLGGVRENGACRRFFHFFQWFLALPNSNLQYGIHFLDVLESKLDSWPPGSAPGRQGALGPLGHPLGTLGHPWGPEACGLQGSRGSLGAAWIPWWALGHTGTWGSGKAAKGM